MYVCILILSDNNRWGRDRDQRRTKEDPTAAKACAMPQGTMVQPRYPYMLPWSHTLQVWGERKVLWEIRLRSKSLSLLPRYHKTQIWDLSKMLWNARL